MTNAYTMSFNTIKRFINCTLILYFSYITYPNLQTAAETNFARIRLRPALPHFQFLIPGDVNEWGKNKPVNKDRITKATAGVFPKPKWYEKDRTMMRKFLDNIKEGQFNLPDIAPIESIMPIPVPVFDTVKNIMMKQGTWQYPPKTTWGGWSEKRAVSWASVDNVDVREVFVGSTPVEEIWQFINWLDDRHEANQNELGTGVMSLDVEEIRVSYFDYLRVTSRE